MINTLNDLLRGVDLTTLRRQLSVKFNPPSRHPATSSKAPVTLTPAFRDASALHSMTLLMLNSFPRAAEVASATAAEEEDELFRPTPIGISDLVEMVPEYSLGVSPQLPRTEATISTASLDSALSPFISTLQFPRASSSSTSASVSRATPTVAPFPPARAFTMLTAPNAFPAPLIIVILIPPQARRVAPLS